MKRIRITSIPDGPNIPEKVREGWLGVEFEVIGPMKTRLSSVTNPKEYCGEKWVYKVPVDTALKALKKKNKTAWQWFATAPIRIPVFYFAVESCTEIST